MTVKQVFKKYESLPVQIRASFWFLICSFLQKAISALSTPIFTRLLSSSEFGQFNVFLSWQSILRVFVTLNLFYGVFTSGLVKFEDRRPEFTSSMLGLTSLLVFFWLVVYLCFREHFNYLLGLSTIQTVCMILQFWTTAVFSFWAAEQRVDYKYRRLVVVTLCVSVAKPLLGVILVLTAQDKVTARIVGLLAVEAVGFSWMYIEQYRRYPKLYSGFFWKYALVFNIPLVPHYLAQNILNNSDRIMIGRMVSESSAGIYSLAYTLALTMNLFNTALSQTIGPWVYGKIKARKENEIREVVLPSVWIIALVNLVLISFAPEVIRIFAPPEYYEAIWTIPPVVISVYYTYLYGVFSYYEFYYEKTRFIALATMVSAAVNVVLNYYCISSFGYIAAGYTTLVCFILYAFAHYCVMKQIAVEHLDGNMIVDSKKLLITSVLFTAIGLSFCFVYPYPIIRYGVLLAGLVIILLCREKLHSLITSILSTRKSNKQ